MSDLIQIVEDVVHVSVDEARVEVVSVGVQGPAGRDGADGAPGQDGQGGADGAPGPEGPEGPQCAPTTVESLGLERVDDTRDLEKPVSEAQVEAIEAARDAAKDYTDAVAALKADVTALQAVLDGLAGKANFPTVGSSISIRTAAGAQNSLPFSTAAVSGDIVRRDSGGQINGASPTLPGHSTRKDYVDVLVPIYGTGFPNVVVTAAVGRIYSDTACTNGASSWIKKTGAGNTGWEVLEGDTGWRAITHTRISNGFVLLRRVNNIC